MAKYRQGRGKIKKATIKTVIHLFKDEKVKKLVTIKNIFNFNRSITV